MAEMRCKNAKCRSTRLVKNGKVDTNGKQRWKCKACKRTFTEGGRRVV